jgi:hypothetical protein
MSQSLILVEPGVLTIFSVDIMIPKVSVNWKGQSDGTVEHGQLACSDNLAAMWKSNLQVDEKKP